MEQGEASLNIEDIEDTEIYTPQTNEILKPKPGMAFDSIEEGKEFYLKYAREGGFGIRSSSTGYSKTKELQYKVFVCAKEGTPNIRPKPLDVAVRRRKHVIREGCKSAIRFTKNSEGKWAVTKFTEGHNHPLATPSKTHLFPSHRQITPTKKTLFKQARAANIGISKTVSLLGIQSVGYENIGCTERDIRNLDQKEKHAEKEYDAYNLLEHFKTEQESNPGFFYAFEADDEDRLTHCFWTDGRARKAYHYFGDVVVFDTTYETNQYSMIFAPFTGINHHGQSTVFGAGFLKDEKTESFVWLFQKFLEAMSNKEPEVIITDQDPAMAAAIRIVLARAHHRFCMWHIMSKVSEKLGATAYDNNFINPFKHCIWNSETSNEFETKWKDVIENSELQGNKWLQSLYEIRAKWIPAYSMDIFTAGCRTTQRSESMNSFFSHYVRKKNTLVEFYTNFEMAAKRMRHRELEADHGSVNSKPQMKTQFSMEKQMATVYTRGIFNLFQDELVESMQYGASPTIMDDCSITYTVKKEGELKMKSVKYIKENNEARCSCKMFETEGVPCRHMLLVLRLQFVTSLPEHYILNRWTINALANPVFDIAGVELRGSHNPISHTSTDEWSQILQKCILKAKHSPEAGKLFHDALVNVNEELDQLKSAQDQNERSHSSIPTSYPPQIYIRPPDISKTKGSGKRFKGGKEISMEQVRSKERLCHGCGIRGADHDKQNCPVLRKMVESQGSVTNMYGEESPNEDCTNLD